MAHCTSDNVKTQTAKVRFVQMITHDHSCNIIRLLHSLNDWHSVGRQEAFGVMGHRLTEILTIDCAEVCARRSSRRSLLLQKRLYELSCSSHEA